MGSGVSARVSGLLALGNQVTSNSSACSTGAEAVVEGYQRIQAGLAERMLCGGTEGSSHYTWGGFDSMRVLCRKFNDEPEKASRPLSASAAGFVPGSGAGILHLESLESAESRGARIYAEVLGGALNCGGHRSGGSMTAPNPVGVQRCIREAVGAAGIQPHEIDAINGHLTASGIGLAVTEMLRDRGVMGHRAGPDAGCVPVDQLHEIDDRPWAGSRGCAGVRRVYSHAAGRICACVYKLRGCAPGDRTVRRVYPA